MSERADGLLSIVATPIGHLDDITLRALRTLRDADTILAEDTRHTRKLLTHHGITTRLRALHAHSSPAQIERALEELKAGAHLALVTDAGTPLVSDPGLALSRVAAEAGVRVEAIPGASAVLAALCASGLPFDRFSFHGFAPRAGGKREAWLERIAREEHAHVLFEAPTRVAQTLRDLAQRLSPNRPVAVCRELTKLHEEVVRGTAAELAERFAEGARGEITIVVGAGQVTEPSSTQKERPRCERIKELLAQGSSPRDVARTLAIELGVSRRELYAEVQAVLAEQRAPSK